MGRCQAIQVTTQGDDSGLNVVSAGARGPMSVDKIPGKFLNLGTQPEAYRTFCHGFAKCMQSEEDWWAMMVFLAVHDIGKSDEFRNRVNSTLPKARRTDDHDRILAIALQDPQLLEELLPSVKGLGVERQQKIADGFATQFQLPQLGQGETAVDSLRSLLQLDRQRILDGTLQVYLYHSIFDVAGAAANENFIFPVALQPVYIGFTSAMAGLLERLQSPRKTDESSLYFDFLRTNFEKAYPEFARDPFANLCESRVFRSEVGLVLLRVLALTRNTYKNPACALSCLLTSYPTLVNEMAGKVAGPQIMLYYAPDMLRMGLGTDLEDALWSVWGSGLVRVGIPTAGRPSGRSRRGLAHWT